MRYSISALGLMVAASTLGAQTWAGLATYGGPDYDQMWGLDFRGDTLPVLLMFTISYSISGNDEDFILMVPTVPQWKKVIGNSSGRDDWAYGVAWQTTGNIAVGGTWCYDGGAGAGSCYAPLYGFLIQMSSTGNFLRGRHLDPSASWTCDADGRQTRILNVWPTNDGGVVSAGYMTYNESDSWGNCDVSESDAFIAKFDAYLNLQWIKPVGTANWELATTAIQTTDGNYVLIAPSFYEIWIGKFNSSGNLLWQRRYPRTYYDDGRGKFFGWAKPTSDGGFILADEIDGPGGNSRDALFVKFRSNGSVQCARVLYTSSHDVGVDVVEGPNYYWMTGFFRNSDLFIAAFDKATCNLEKFRYLLSSGVESGRSMDLSDNNIPYVAGYTDNPAWSVGDYDALVAADSGGVDTCYWRSYPISNSSVSLTQSGSWNVYSFSYTPSNYSVSAVNVDPGIDVICGLALGPEGDSELGTEERFVDCYLNYAVVGNEVRIRVKGQTDLQVELYTADGRKVYDRYLKGFSGVLRIPNLRKGIYLLRMRHGGGETKRKITIR
ncbi:MAG: T9SS type A sorting domain-containing protein [Thermotogae bacterium]|nr:T9SS type A sorting domain-containing protein [Thermotogota bacterium]